MVRDPARLLLLAAVSAACSAMALPLHLPAVAGRLTGATARATTRPDHTGEGYATNFAKAADTVAFQVLSAAPGPYDVRLRYCSPTGHKSITVRANGVAIDVMLPQTGPAWTTLDAGRVELTAGDNDLAVGGGWGHYDFDSVDLTPATVVPLTAPSAELCDPQATPAARALMARLVAGVGTVTLTGGYGDTEDAWVRDHTGGRRPAVYGSDLMDFSPSRVAHGTRTAGIVEDVLRHAADGQAITVSWHWNAPAGLVDTVRKRKDGGTDDLRWYKGFNADATTFDVAAALADERSPDHALLLRDIDAIAVPLRRLADAGVPVLWRPLHEAEGAWFWWGAKGPTPFVQLWRLMHDRLARVHGLHNLIWVYSYTLLGDPQWYPGDDVVDVVGMDGYPSDNRDPLGRPWRNAAAFAPNKLRALTEFGGVPDVDRMHRLGYPWAYFVSWSGDHGPALTGPVEVARRYGSPRSADLLRWEPTR